jgi:arsenate reductase-like glutaredoxin family protein
LNEKKLNKGKFQSVLQNVGSLEKMIDPDCKDKELLALIRHIAAEDKSQKVFENQAVLKQPIVRNGRAASLGYAPELWKTWD